MKIKHKFQITFLFILINWKRITGKTGFENVMKIPVFLLLFFGFVLTAYSKNEVITIETLLQEMVDRANLAQIPEQEYTCKQFSSYDRAMVASDSTGWFANWDRSMFMREEEHNGRKEYVMMDTKGPGAIVRFWMTFAGENCGKGILRIYFDQSSEPAFEGGAMELLSGSKLAGKPLSSSVSDSTGYEMRGHNLYLPLPYARHCKITYESTNIKDAGAKTGGEAVYYNVNYRTYVPGTEVRTVSAEELKKASATIKRVENLLKEGNKIPEGIKVIKKSFSGKIATGQSLTRTIDGSQAIRKLSLKLNASNKEQALRTTVLKMKFDDEQTVWCPLGDFFGTGYQIRESRTYYTQVSNDGTMTVYWVMPFKKNCTMTIRNIGKEDVEISDGEIAVSGWKWDERSMHFGASWHQFTHLHTGDMKNNEGTAGNPFDINYVTLAGKGRYVGDAITLFNTVYAWWGEGDEKVYVDGESFPSHIGTGTEDYYGYAWCRPEKFINHPFISQPDGSGNFDPGYTINMRFRGLDDIPFNSSLKFDMEMWHWTRAVINFAPVSFWYMVPGGKTTILPDEEGAEAPVVLKRSDIIPPGLQEEGDTLSIEGENLIYENTTGGGFRYQNSVSRGWSNNMQAFWSDGKPGDKLRLAFISPAQMKKTIDAVLTHSPDYGCFKLILNGKTVALDLQSERFNVQKVHLGSFDILKGKNVITIEITGIAPNENKTTLFGLDKILFSK